MQAAEHAEYITSLAWSPDDSMILLGVENAVKIIDVLVILISFPCLSLFPAALAARSDMLTVLILPPPSPRTSQSGRCTLNVTGHEYCAVGGVAWLPDSAGFFSGGLDMRLLCWVSMSRLGQHSVDYALAHS